MDFDVKFGIVTGREHQRRGVNRQDAVRIISGEIFSEPFIVGFIADGCGEGSNSEVGANLAVNFACNQVRSLLGIVNLSAVGDILYQSTKEMLGQIIASQQFIDPAEKVAFVRDHLLFTLIGFIYYQGKLLILSSGDGTIVIDDEITLLDWDNKPLYLAYHLVERRFLSDEASALPDSFEETLIDLDDFERIAIGSDAWHPEAERELLVSEVWNLGENPRKLNRQMKVWSAKQKLFQDDAVLITLEKVAKELKE